MVNEGLVVLGLMFTQYQYVELFHVPYYIATGSLSFMVKQMLEIVTYLFTKVYASVWCPGSLFYTISEGLNNFVPSLELSRVYKKSKGMLIKAGVAPAVKYITDKLVLLIIV